MLHIPKRLRASASVRVQSTTETLQSRTSAQIIWSRPASRCSRLASSDGKEREVAIRQKKPEARPTARRVKSGTTAVGRVFKDVVRPP